MVMKDHNGPSQVSAHSEVTKNYWAQWDSLCLRNDILCQKWESLDGTTTQLQLVLPKALLLLTSGHGLFFEVAGSICFAKSRRQKQLLRL